MSGRAFPGRSAGRHRPPAGGSRRCAAGRAVRCRCRTPAARSRSCTMRRTVRGSIRPPRTPRNNAGPLAAVAITGRPACSHRLTARTAGMPTGTVRSFPPLPNTRTVRRPRSSAPRSSPHSSLTRIPVAYSNSSTAASRSATAASAGVRSEGGCAMSASDDARTSAISAGRRTCGSARRTFGVPSTGPGVTGQPATPMSERGEGAGRRPAPRERRARRPRRMLDGQPAAQNRRAQLAGTGGAAPVSVLQQRADVADVPADGVARQTALGSDVTFERRRRVVYPRRSGHRYG